MLKIKDHDYPTIHIRPPFNHINDPNGMIWYKGVYHIYAQYNPYGPVWGNIHWIHLSTTDFTSWKNHDISLSPDKGYDAKGCWSGCTFITEKGPALIYSAFDGKQTKPALAWGTNDLKIWKKIDHNPIIKDLPRQDLFGFRDHKVFQKDGSWYQLIGSGYKGKGVIYCYTSHDLLSWNYLGVWYTHDHKSENMLECPDYVTIGNQKVLIYSTNNPYVDKTLQSYWALGQEVDDLKNDIFKAFNSGIIDVGCFYAPQCMFDGSRVLMIGWLREERSNEELVRAGWSGALSLPRILEIKNDKLLMYPIKELESLREKETRLVIDMKTRKNVELETDNGLLEFIISSSNVKTSDKIEIIIGSKIDENSNLTIILENNSGTIKYSGNEEKNQTFPCFFNQQHTIIHGFIDHSIIELFVNYEFSISRRMYNFGENLKIDIRSTKEIKINHFQLKHIIIS